MGKKKGEGVLSKPAKFVSGGFDVDISSVYFYK